MRYWMSCTFSLEASVPRISQDRIPRKHTTREHNFLRLEPNLRTRRIAQSPQKTTAPILRYVAEKFWGLICAPRINRQLPNNLPPRPLCLHPPYQRRSPLSPKAGGPEILKTDSTITEKTVREKASRTYCVMSSPSLPKQVAKNF